MKKTTPSERERQILSDIRNHINRHQDPPQTKWLAEQLLRRMNPRALEDEDERPSEHYLREFKAARKNLLTILGRLEKKGLISRPDKRPRLTQAAVTYFEESLASIETATTIKILPAQIAVRGTVQAGRKEHELDVDLATAETRPILVPDVNPDRTTYALRVEGASMLHENIREGDYVIVEEFGPSRWPADGDMIVTYYIDLSSDDLDEEFDDIELDGPSLKYYFRILERRSNQPNAEEEICRLGWRKDNLSNQEHLIRAARIRPVGKVIGVYRPITQEK